MLTACIYIMCNLSYPWYGMYMYVYMYAYIHIPELGTWSFTALFPDNL